jgi:hypothetical protein
MSSAIIIKQLQTTGINFKPDVDNLLELRKANLPDEVLDALISLGSPRPQVGPQSAFLDLARVLYAKGDFAGVAELAKQRLASDSRDSAARYLLGVASLRLNQRDIAQAQLSSLETTQDASSTTLGAKLSALLKRFDSLHKSKSALETELRSYNSANASQVIEHMDVPAVQKELLHVYLNAYRGRFELARYGLENLQGTRPDLEQDWLTVRTFIDRSAMEYQNNLARLAWLGQFSWDQGTWMTSGHPSFWVPEGLQPFYDSQSTLMTAQNMSPIQSVSGELLRQTFETASKLVQVAPLDQASLTWLFQIALMTRPYETVQELGDRILSSQDRLVVQMAAKQGLFYLLIDKKNGVLSLVAAPPLTRWVKGRGSDVVEDGIPFSVKFDEIVSGRQGEKFWYGFHGFGPLYRPAKMFEITPQVTFSEFTLLPDFTIVYGEKATRQVVYNFGKFLLHVIDRPNLQATLIGLEAKGRSTWNFGSVLLGAVAVANGAAGNTAQSSILLGELDRRDQQVSDTNAQQQQQSMAWEKLAADASFDLPIKMMFREFEGALKDLQ